MKLLDFVGLEKRAAHTSVLDTERGPFGLPLPTRTNYGYQGLPAVFRALTVLQTAANQLSIDAWNGNQQLTGDQYPRALRSPYDFDTQNDLINDLVASQAFHGNAYALAIRDKESRLCGIKVLDPLVCTPFIDDKTGWKYVNYDGRDYRANDLAHMRLIRVPGRELGLSPIGFARETFERAHNIARVNAELYEKGGIPTGILTSEQPINPEQAKQAKEAWNQSNSAKGGVAVIGAGLSYKQLTINPADAQFLETQKYSDQQIAMLFGIPPHLMGITLDGNSMTYQNIQEANVSFMTWTVVQYLKSIEEGLTKLLPRNTYARFNLDAILRPDTKKRMETHEIAIRAGVYSAHYAATEIEGLPATALGAKNDENTSL